MVNKLCSVFTNQIPYHEIFLNGFASGAFMELNYAQEAENQMYFRKELHSRFGGSTRNKSVSSNDKKNYNNNFRLPFLRSNRRNSQVEKVIVPQVYNQYTTQCILVSEWIDGIPLAQARTEQIQELIPIGVELFLCQLLDIGRFHADPHPGECMDWAGALHVMHDTWQVCSFFLFVDHTIILLPRKLVRDKIKNQWHNTYSMPIGL